MLGAKLRDSLFNEGPHVWITDSGFLVCWIDSGVVKSLFDRSENANGFESIYGFNPYPHYTHMLSEDYGRQYQFEGIANYAAISDIHGQFDLYVILLKAHGIIDSALNWSYGAGHLIILGDIMDRGIGVTEALWLTYKLESQALAAGGRVHFLCGNHEAMVMDDDLGYVDQKYLTTATLMGTTHHELYGPSTLLGRWLHKRPIMLTINDDLITHAGASPELVDNAFSISQINTLFIDSIYPQSKTKWWYDKQLHFLATSKGPLWYRGYFSGKFREEDMVDILHYFNKRRIIVGHTPSGEIRNMFNGKLLAIDASVQSGKNGEILLYEKGIYARGLIDGGTLPLMVSP
ncbi:metallophosphoesterase [Parapedobacter tibetensis]|uniref:metallophosphoesterase n=1 Tax=Parapedobacter tibetensis TaxID=2972951 RepID=UPI00214D311F|nr:metallophosphoesterase [Parapedobacter tibetensis]